MKRILFTLVLLFAGMVSLQANPVDLSMAKTAAAQEIADEVYKLLEKNV